jgi:hypothetical protein
MQLRLVRLIDVQEKNFPNATGIIGKLLRPIFEERFTASLKFGSLIGASCLPENFSQSYPSARNANRIAKIVVQIKLPGHEFFLDLLIFPDRLTVLMGPCEKICGGTQSVVGLAHRLDFVSRVHFCITQKLKALSIRRLASSTWPVQRNA